MPFEPFDEAVRPAVDTLRREIPRARVPTLGETLGAAFRLENMIGSEIVQEDDSAGDGPLRFAEKFDPEYFVEDEIAGTKYDAPGLREKFVMSFHPETTAAIMRDLDREQEDRETLEAAPFGLTLALTGAASVLDPTMLLPGGQIYKGVKAGQAVGRSALSVGAGAAGATALQEIGLHDSQKLRTLEESAVNVAAATALGSILGAGAASLSRSAQVRLAKKLEGEIETLKSVDDDFRSLVTETGSAGAARADLESEVARILRTELGREPTAVEISARLDDATKVVGEAVLKKTPLVSIQDPLIRTALSDSRQTREIAMRLAESPLEFRGNADGISMSSGGSVEGRIRIHQRKLDRGLNRMDELYADYFFDGQRKRAGATRAIAARTVGIRPNKLTYKEFRQAIGLAMMEADKVADDIPAQVAKAAKAMRDEIINPTTKDAQDAGVLPRNLAETDHHGETYFPRVYRVNEIKARRADSSADNPGFEDLLHGELMKSQGKAQDKAALSRDVDLAQGELDKALEAQRQLRTGLRAVTTKARDRLASAAKKAGESSAAIRELDQVSFRLFRRMKDAKAKDVTDEERAAAKELIDFVRKSKEPPSLFDEIRKRGGLKLDDAGELSAVTGDMKSAYKRQGKKVFPQNSIIAKDGMNLDDARSLLADEGYLDGSSTVDDFVQLIDQEMRGEKVYSRDDASQVDAFRAAQDIKATLDEAGAGLNIDSIVGVARSQDGKVPVDKVAARKEAEVAVKGEAEVQRVRGSLIDRLNDATTRIEIARAQVDEIETNVKPRMREQISRADARVASARKVLRRAREEDSALQDFIEMSPDELREVVREITDRIIGAPEGRMIGAENFLKAGETGPRGALRERTLKFVGSRVLARHGFLETDVENVMRHYMRTVPVDTELTRAFGSTDMSAQLKQIKDDYAAKIRDADGDQKAQERLSKREKADTRDVEGMRDRIRGLYKIPDDPDAFLVRTGRALRSFNYIRLLGGMTISAISDLGKPIFTGSKSELIGGFARMLSDWKRFKLAAEEVKDAGTALDMTLGTRAMAWADVNESFTNRTIAENALNAASGRFGLVTLMNPWNAGLKQFAGALITQRVIRESRAWIAGIADEASIRRLAQAGITRDHAARIVEQVDKHGDFDGSFILARGNDWDDNARDALEAFRVAIARDVDRAIVTPGQDKPLLMSTELGALLGQFKSFAFSSVQRTLISGLQQRDMRALNGFLSMFFLGGVSYFLKEINAGREPSDDPAVIAAEAFDRSGVVGWLMDVNNLTERFSGGAVGMSALTGQELSRFQIRNNVGSLLGPSAGIGGDVFSMSAAVLSEDHDIRESDIHRMRMLIPAQNLFYLRWMFNRLEAQAVDTLGVN